MDLALPRQLLSPGDNSLWSKPLLLLYMRFQCRAADCFARRRSRWVRLFETPSGVFFRGGARPGLFELWASTGVGLHSRCRISMSGQARALFPYPCIASFSRLSSLARVCLTVN